MDDNLIIWEQFAVPGGKVFIGGVWTSTQDDDEPTDNIAYGSWLIRSYHGDVRMYDKTKGWWTIFSLAG